MSNLSKKGKTSSLLILTILALSAISAFVSRKTVEASGETKLAVLPKANEFFTNTTLPGTVFTINITVINVTDLQNWQIKLKWDPTLLNFSKIWLPKDHVFSPIDQSINPTAPGARAMITAGPIVDYAAGTVTYGCTYINVDPYPYWTFNGTGTLCQVNLTILTPPVPPPVSCDLELINIPDDTFLLNGRMMDITFTPEASSFSYTDTLKVTLTPSGTIYVEVGESVTFTASASGGVPPYNYSWFVNDVKVPGAESETFVFQASSSGRYNIKVVVTDDLGYNATATAVVQTRPLSVVLEPSSTAVDVGFSKTFTATVTGGKKPYDYTWYLIYPNNTEVEVTEAKGQASCTITFTEVGTNKVKVNVTDAEGKWDIKTSIVFVYPTPTTTVKIIPETVTFYTNQTIIGEKIVFNVTVQDVEQLYNWQIKVTWDPELLNFSNIIIPEDHVFAGAEEAGKALYYAGPVIEPGSLVYGCTITEDLPYWTFNGTGVLCQIELEIIRQPSAPQSSCTIGLAEKYDTTFLEAWIPPGQNIPFNIENATYNYVLVERVRHSLLGYTVETYSNAIILANSVTQSEGKTAINFNVYGAPGTSAFVNVTIPKALLTDSWVIYLNGVDKTSDAQITEDATNTYVYIEFVFASTVNVEIEGSWIVPELPNVYLLTAILLISAASTVFLTNKRSPHKK
jgi:hypothetical protein